MLSSWSPWGWATISLSLFHFVRTLCWLEKECSADGTVIQGEGVAVLGGALVTAQSTKFLWPNVVCTVTWNIHANILREEHHLSWFVVPDVILHCHLCILAFIQGYLQHKIWNEKIWNISLCIDLANHEMSTEQTWFLLNWLRSLQPLAEENLISNIDFQTSFQLPWHVFNGICSFLQKASWKLGSQLLWRHSK